RSGRRIPVLPPCSPRPERSFGRGRNDVEAGMSPDESINCAVRDHEITTEWDHRELAETLHRFAERFNAEFFGGSLPCVFLTFEHARITTLGHYRPGRNAVGAVHEINLNTRHLGRPLFDLLG